MLKKTVDDPYIIWDKMEIAEVNVDTTTLGMLKVRVKVVYAYDETSVMGATTIVNGKLCREIEPGVYECEISTWNPYQMVTVHVDPTNFPGATKIASTVHIINIALYLTLFTIGTLIVVLLIRHIYKS